MIFKGHHVQHSYPVLVARRGQGRRLPPTPCKPSTLQLKPSNINFPKLNASPTHVRFSVFNHFLHSEIKFFLINIFPFIFSVLFTNTSFDATQ